MDRLAELRGTAGGSGDTTLDSSAAYMTASESSQYFSLSEVDSSFDISKDVTLTSPVSEVTLTTVVPDATLTTEKPGNEQTIDNLTPIADKSNPLDSYKFENQIEAANILSGGVDIFDDNDNSYDGNELVIDDNVEIEDKNSEMKLCENSEKRDELSDNDSDIASKDTEVVLQIDGKSVNAINIGNGLYLYRKAGEEELAAVEIMDDGQDHPTFRFLKVRENAEGNLEVYEEIEIEVPKQAPAKAGRVSDKSASHVPIKQINKVITDPSSNKIVESNNQTLQAAPIASTSINEDFTNVQISDNKTEMSLNGKMVKFNETRKSPVIHSTSNKGIPLTKTMVDQQLHPKRQLDNVKTIEVHTDPISVCTSIRVSESKCKDVAEDTKTVDVISKETEKPVETAKITEDSKHIAVKTTAIQMFPKIDCPITKSTEIETKDTIKLKQVNATKSTEVKPLEGEVQATPVTKEENESCVKPEENSGTKPSCEKLAETGRAQITENRTENVPEVAGVQKISADSGDNLKFIPDENTKATVLAQKDNLETHVILNKNKEEDKSNKSVLKTEGENQITERRPDKSQDTLDDNYHHISSGITKTENKSPKTCAVEKIEASCEIEKEKSEKKIPLNQETSTNIIPSQVNISSTPKIKCEQKPIEDLRIIEKAEKLNKNLPSPTQSESLTYTEAAKSDFTISTTNASVAQKIPDQKVKIVEDIIISPGRKEAEELKRKDIVTSKNLKNDSKMTVPVEPNLSTASDTYASVEYKAPVVRDKPSAKDVNINKKEGQKIPDCTFNVTKQETTHERENAKTETITLKVDNVNIIIPNNQPALQNKSELKTEPVKHNTLDMKQVNNNAAVPFGKWTEANRQEFLNKFKETKIHSNTSNTKQIKQANDLNRRDVLQKIDSKRHSSNAVPRGYEPSKTNIKNEGTYTQKPASNSSSIAFRETKASVKVQVPDPNTKPLLLKKPEKPDVQTSKAQTNLTVTSAYMLKSEGSRRNEFNNQDLIDRTVEGIIYRVDTVKPQDLKQNAQKEQIHPPRETAYSVNSKAKEKQPAMLLDAIEMKMNELHGIPFVERPPHQLPRVFNRDVKTYSKADINSSSNKPSKIPALLPVAAPSQPKPVNVKDSAIDLDSEDEVIEHEPVTGDIDLHKSKMAVAAPYVPHNINLNKKESVITEQDFDKFYRRNSVTYNSDLYPNTKITSSTAVDLGTKTVASQLPIQKASFSSMPTNKLQMTSKLLSVDEDLFTKNYPSKLQMAYQTTLATKNQMVTPITIIEDKPVKVVFMDSNTDFTVAQLNVQGPQLSPRKKSAPERTPDPDSITNSTGDSLDSDVLDSIDEKVPDETKPKTKHQRKQVLSPVETPELELIAPSDLGIEVSPKKRRRIDDNKHEKNSKNIVPKKTYLLERNVAVDTLLPQELTKDIHKDIPIKNLMIGHSDAASAIDHLVKAAELLETHSAHFQADSLPASGNESSQTETPTPVKRGRGRPRKYPLPEGTPDKKTPSPQKKPRLIDARQRRHVSTSEDDDSSSDGMTIKENWTMGKINENIVCPICNKLFRSENVVFKHVKHCTGPSPNRSESDKRRSQSRDTRSLDSKFDDSDGDSDQPLVKKNTPKKRKSKEPSPVREHTVIVIEDTPVKERNDKQEEPRKPTKTKAEYKVSDLSCDHCGKTFRQLSYLVSHKLLHKKDNVEKQSHPVDKNVYSCEICKKEFRKLHHLVQHRIIHNPPSRPSRKSSAEQSLDKRSTKEQEHKLKNDDQSAAFRCEPCDKSFRKLHHLVEHRETHDGINRHKNISTAQSSSDKPIARADPPPQCDICKKTFRKLHHLSEHKEQHVDTMYNKTAETCAKSPLSTKDIIHECSLCYMVFPNEHSLNKHFVNCQRKKRQAAAKQAKQQAEAAKAEENKEIPQQIETTTEPPPTSPKPIDNTINVVSENIEKANPSDVTCKTIEELTSTERRLSKEQETKLQESLPSKSSKRDLDEPPQVVDIPEETEENSGKEFKEALLSKNKTPVKEREQATVIKRRKSNLPLAPIKETSVESSDDDEIKYMLNPAYKDSKPESSSSTEGKFLQIRSKRRSDLGFEQPHAKEFAKRLILPLNLSKVTQKSKSIEKSEDIPPIVMPTAKIEPATDSDDSDVKYSFPIKPHKSGEPDKTEKVSKAKVKTPMKRKLLTEKRKTVSSIGKRNSLSSIAKRKSLSSIAKRKSLGKLAPAKGEKEFKKRRIEVEHRCDCGQLFSSAALLARHTTLAHTPPRSNRRRVDSPVAVASKQTVSAAPTLSFSAAPKETVDVAPKATVTRGPKATVTVVPKPTVNAAPKPRVSAAPKPTVSAAPKLPVTRAPKTTVTALPQPTVSTALIPRVSAVPKSRVSALPKPTVSAAPKSTVSAAPKSTVSAAPKSTVSAAPKSTVSAAPKPTVSARPKSTVSAAPKPTVSAAPKPTGSTAPKPTVTTSPKPTVTASPKPTVGASPKPTVSASPKPSVGASPKPTGSAVPKQTVSTEGKPDKETPRKKPGRPPGKTPRKSIKPEATLATIKKTRRSAAHSGVPNTEKCKKMIQKLRKLED